MNKTATDNRPFYILLGIVVLFLIGRLVGGALFSNGWSFRQWHYIPSWYIIAWLVGFGLLAVVFIKYLTHIGTFLEKKLNRIIGGILLLALTWFFQFDSFLYGGGNLRIAQVAQTEDIILRWYEYGTVFIVYLLKTFYDLFGLHYNTAGVYAWKTLSFTCSILSLIGSLFIARELITDKAHRVVLFLALWAGPQVLLNFGFIGIEPVIVTVTIWFAYLALMLFRHFTVTRLLSLWLLLAVGIFFHITTIYLVPTAMFVTLTTLPFFTNKKPVSIALVIALLVWTGLVAWLYIRSESNLEIARYILLLVGKNPHSNYGLFSWRHIGDIIQIIFLAFPLILLVKYVIVTHLRNIFSQPLTITALLMWGCGVTALFIADPIHSVVLDFPKLTAFLTPGGFLLAVVVSYLFSESNITKSSKFTGLLSAVIIALPLSYAPVYLSIHKAEGYVETYLNGHDAYWLQGAPALRDAFFYIKDFDRANYWDQIDIVKSSDYLNYTGILELAAANQTGDALRSLNPLMTRNPYWADLRIAYAQIMMQLKRYDLAKPQIDTALMLDPYNKQALKSLYTYYRDTKSITRALDAVKQAISLYPSDTDIKIDLMTIWFRMGLYNKADSLAERLMTIDSSLAHPYLIKGLSLEKQQRFREAMTYYNKFLQLAPDNPDTLVAKKGIERVKANLQHDK